MEIRIFHYNPLYFNNKIDNGTIIALNGFEGSNGQNILMIESSKIYSERLWIAGVLLWTLGMTSSGLAQVPATDAASGRNLTVVEEVRLGKAPPEFTRVVIQLSRRTTYRFIPDLANKRIALFIRKAKLDPEVRSQIYQERNLERIDIREIGNHVKLTLNYKNSNTRIIHFIQHNPHQIILDLKGDRGEIFMAGKPTAIKDRSPRRPKKILRKPSAHKSIVPGLSAEKIRQAIRADQESKFKSGDKDYEKALLLFQRKDYLEAVPALKAFSRKYPESRYRANATYLMAEAKYNLAVQDPAPKFEEALEAYQYAMRQYPKSSFYDHALLKISSIFEAMDYTLEAKTLYLEGLRRNKRSRYIPARQLGLAKMLLKEEKIDEAYKAFQMILKKTPSDVGARVGVYRIAQWYFDRGDYQAALPIYEDAVKRWPDQLSRRPQINFQIGEIYFSAKHWDRAREYYFNLVNLDPESATAHKALNRIGDSYLLEDTGQTVQQGQSALSVFDQSYRNAPGSDESQYAKIRLADIGLRYPTLPVRDLIFEIPPFIDPYQAYREVFQESQSRDILSEVTLSRGSAYYQEQRYLEAIDEFKKLLPWAPNTRFHRSAQNFIRLAVISLIDQYAKQQGHLPILYAYGDYVGLGLGDIQNIKTRLQIGESYMAIGIHSEALEFFETVKLSDLNGAYTDRLFLNLGQIHLSETQFKEAERVAKTFLNTFPESPRVPEALLILADAYQGQKRFDDAIRTYRTLLSDHDFKKSLMHYRIAETHFAKGNLRQSVQAHRKAIDTYDRKIRNLPEFIQTAYYKLGILQHMQGNFKGSLDALQAGRKLFPDHPLRDWADFLIADNLDQLNRKDDAFKELNQLVESYPPENLIQQAAESRLKIIDWEKHLKELL